MSPPDRDGSCICVMLAIKDAGGDYHMLLHVSRRVLDVVGDFALSSVEALGRA